MSMYDNESVSQTPRYADRGETYVDETYTPSAKHYPINRNAPDFGPLDIAAFAVAVVMIWGPMLAGASHWGMH